MSEIKGKKGVGQALPQGKPMSGKKPYNNSKSNNGKGDKKKASRNKEKKKNEKRNIRNINLSFMAPQGIGEGLNVKKMIGDNKKYDEWAQFIETLKARGPDIRMVGSALSTSGMLSDTAIEVNKVAVDIQVETLWGVAVACVSHAYTHGWRQQVMNDDKGYYPYFSALFIYNALLSVVSGIQNKVPKVGFPDFLLEIMAALQPKEGVQIGSGTMGYSWTLFNQSYNPGDKFLYPNYGEYTFWIATNALESGYNKMAQPTVSAYTEDEGALAFTAMINFMDKRLIGPKNKYRPYAKRDFKLKGTLLEKSASAFAYSSCVIGGGMPGGYVSSLVSLETYIHHPKFGVFAAPTQSIRGYRNHKPSAGDSNWLVGSLLMQQKALEVTNPNYPVFKPVDFYEFCDRVAMYLASAFTKYYHDTSFDTSGLVNLGMTYVDFLIIMRKILMRNFNATQYAVQSLRFYPSSLGSSDDFIPLLCAAGTCSSSNMGTLKLPLFAVENLNALRGRAVYPNINPVSKKLIDKYPRLYVPVLGVYTKATFDPKKYQYLDAGDTTVDLFLPTADTLNVVDGKLNSSIVDLDCSPFIQTNIGIFNSCVTTLSTYTQQLTEFTGDAGINMLTVIGDTFVLTERKENSSSKKDKKKDKDKKKPKDPKVVVIDKEIVSRISQQIPLVDIAPIKRMFVTPEYLVFKSNSGVGSVSASLLRTLNTELWMEYDGQRYTASNDGNYTDINVLRKQWVENCVKNRSADNNTIIEQILKLTKAGAAGLLGELVGVFGGELASGAIRSASSFIPI